MKPNITYKNTHTFSKKQLEDLFLSVESSSGNFPERLVIAMRNFETVYSAWDGDKLVGMVCVMDDGIMTAYVHYLLVRPDYQLKGIGKELVERVKNRYKDYMRIVVVARDEQAKFYEYCGFEKSEDSVVMFINK